MTLREQFNAALFVLEVYLLVILAIALWRSYQRSGSFRTWRTTANVAALLGLTTFILGDTLRALWVWPLLKSFNDTGNSGTVYRWLTNQWEFALISVVLACVGLVCAIRWLSPPGWGPTNAVWSMAITIGVLVLAAFVTFH